MPFKLAEKVNRIKPSATLAVAAKASEMQAAGEDVIDLSIGEPDFDTPEFVKSAAIQALASGFTKYTAVDGIQSLKKAIIAKFQRENALTYQPNQIIVSSGAKQSLFNLFSALLNTGDEVIIPAPYWVSYPDMVLLADGSPVIVKTNAAQRYKITPSQLASAITPATRLVILNSPSNPSGMAYTQAELAALGEVLLKHPHVLVVTDDIYEHILWGNEPFHNIVNACPALYERTIIVNGVSKAYAMTGWRIGYAAGSPSIIAGMKKIQSQSTSNPNSIAQVAAQAALDGDQSCIHEMKSAFKARHDYLVQRLNTLPGLTCQPADGAFYAFVNIEQALQQLGLADDVAFSEYLLAKAKVAVVPGSAFGTENHIRLSYAVNMGVLEQAVDRIASALTLD